MGSKRLKNSQKMEAAQTSLSGRIDKPIHTYSGMAVVNNGAINMTVHLFAYLFSILWGIYLSVESLNHMIILCLT